MNAKITLVREIARGVDWVKLLAKWDTAMTFDGLNRCHAEWAEKNAGAFMCGKAATMRFNFSDSAVVFKFKTEPYSMKSNECYRYIEAFDKWLNSETATSDATKGPGISYQAKTTETEDDVCRLDIGKFAKDIVNSLAKAGLPTLTADPKDEIACVSMNDNRGIYCYSPSDNIVVAKPKTVNDVRVKSLISRIISKKAV